MSSTPLLKPLVRLAAAIALGSSLGASAALQDLSQTPLASAASNLVKPNISYVLDTSGSMAWSHAPDESQPFHTKVGYKTSQCNSIYYSPNIIYPPPRNADGTTFPNSTYTSAWVNGYNTSAGTVDLSSSFYAYDNTSSFGGGTDTAQPAYYYNYLGSQQPNGLNYQNTGSTFYKECNVAETPSPNSTITFSGSSNTVINGITVNGTQLMSGATPAETSSSALASDVAARITAAGYSATASGSTVTILGPTSAAGATAVITATPPLPSATITFSGTTSTVVTGITVSGTQIMSGPSAPSTSSSAVATNVASMISLAGYSATASGSVVTVTGPASAAGATMVVTKVGPQTATITFTGTDSTAVTSVSVNGTVITSGATVATTSATTMASNLAAKITLAGYSATAASGVVTINGPASANGFTPVVNSTSTATTATITVSGGNSNTSVSSIKVNGVQIMTGTSSSSNSNTTVASNVAAKIGNGFSATTGGTSTITITGPSSALGFTPVITLASGSKTLSPSAFVLGGMTDTETAFANGSSPMTTTVTAFPPPGVMTATIVPFTMFQKVVIGNNSNTGPGGIDERQNFANWFSYYRIRILMMKTGLGRAFVNIGSNYRVGFMTIYTTPSSSTTDPGYLAINDFTTSQKSTWFTKVYSQSPGGGTPLKTALSVAARNMAGKVGPDPQQYSCQQNFILLSTDGYWNAGTPNGVKLDGTTSIGNQDNNVSTAPRPQYDGNLSGSSDTLADVAWYYYNTDLRPTSGPCNTGVAGADVCQDNVPISGLDDAPWQHVTLFTLGLGTNGQLNYTTDYLSGGSADYNAIVSGSKNWPVPVGDKLTTIDDLWHAAVNGHGQYFSARNPDLLVSGLNQALAGVSARLAAGAAAATSNLEPVAGDNFAFVASYTTKEWTGDLQSRTIDLTTGALSATANWSAQSLLDAATTDSTDTRTIFTFLNGAKTDFNPTSFTAAQKAAWFTPTTAPVLSQAGGWTVAQAAQATPDSIINYLRGQFGNEERGSNPGNNQLYRVRSHVLGDIIDGKPVYMRAPPFNYAENNYAAFKSSSAVTSRTGTVFVGANDGMLHAFDSLTGSEIWAYIPSFVLPNLKNLASDGYTNNHQFYVDGSPVVTDVWNGSAWKTILVGGLGGGGKGYYALDVTTPGSPIVLWEYSDTNLGYTYGNPVVGKLSDGSWNVFFTSGYNNIGDGVGRLYVLDAYTGAYKFTVSTGVGTTTSPSGLSKIAGWVDNGLVDNTVQRIYGGDTLGNLWRFDVNDIYPPSGKDALKLAFFLTSSNYAQPITTQPELGLVNNKPVIYVGTGRYLGTSDLTDLNQQSLYAIVDQLTGTGLGNARTETTCPLVQQSLTVINVNTRSTSTLPVDLTTRCGWFLDFNPTGGNTPGERVSVDPKLQLGVLAVATNIPDNSVCSVGGSSFLYFFDYSTGQFVSTSTGNVAGQRIGNAIAVGINTYQLPSGKVVTTVTTSDDQHPTFGNPSNPNAITQGKRVLWRELLN